MATSSRLAYRDYEGRGRPYQGEMDRRRIDEEYDRRQRGYEMQRNYERWEERQRFRPTSPRWWHDDDPRPPRMHDVPPARPGNLWGGRGRW
jgi:hypothetical protein